MCVNSIEQGFWSHPLHRQPALAVEKGKNKNQYIKTVAIYKAVSMMDL